MSDFYMECACHTITCFFSMKSRLDFEGVQEAPSLKKGIRYHNCIMAFILRIFGDKIVDVKDIDGKIYHINRRSLSKWLINNHDKLKTTSKEILLLTTEFYLRGMLDEVLAKKSPHYIVSISKIKNELQVKEEHKRSADTRKDNMSLYEQKLPQEIADLKQKLAKAEAERAVALAKLTR